jgi:hypothetical protein
MSIAVVMAALLIPSYYFEPLGYKALAAHAKAIFVKGHVMTV